MRLNIEDSAWKHIPRLAKEMRWSEREAAGALFRFWRDTQEEEITSAPRGRIITVCALAFESDEETDRFLSALIKAQLAHEDEVGYHIRGNNDHVVRLNGYRSRASKGGIARQKNFNDFAASKQAPAKQVLKQMPSTGEPSFAPLLLTPNTEETTKNLDLRATSKKTRTPKASLVPSVPGVTVAVRNAWTESFEKRYPGQRAVWGQREGGQCKTLLGTFTSDELVDLVRHFFAWKRPEVIKAGHSFGTGGSCFVLKVHELRADMAAPQRRHEAAKLAERERISDTAAADDDQITRIATGETVDAYATGTANRNRLDEAFKPPERTPGQIRESAGSRPQSPDVRGCGDDVLQALEPVCADSGTLFGASQSSGRGENAVHRSNQVSHEGTDGPGTVQANSTTHTRARGSQ